MKTSTKTKSIILIAILTLTIIFALIASLVSNKPYQPDNVVVDNNNTILNDGTIHNLPEAMIFATAQQLNAEPSEKAGNSVTIKAIIEPADATDKNVDWTVAFVNANGDWAKDKTVTDYLTVTPSSAGSATATVTCKQPFAEQIIITVRSQSDNDVTATCTVDFKQFVENITLTYAHDGETAFSVSTASGQAVVIGKLPMTVEKATTAIEYTSQWTVSKSIGTIALDDSKCSPTAKLMLSANAKSYLEGARDNAGINYQPFSGNVVLAEKQKFYIDNGTVMGNMFYCGSLSIIKTALTNYPLHLVITCGDLTIETALTCETSMLYTAVTNITLSPSTLEF